ncbi:hypothetical protein RBU55_18830 [Pseudomonas chlororaphis subsp. aurantiaca]|uniref:hypothetical protein n=1 Tax=Pseudomonas chlororaphis TaxID=587753 RepID=UPI0027DC593D|nr:hypothetical protein [Pseudomonas chlororaphis]WMI97615.1 hypothetical protein RBU55_18830 [Pseudomonas chlororaphis subsp. aurantiaca]
MPPDADIRRLMQLQRLLAEMLIEEDWPRIGKLDLLIREQLKRLQVAEAMTDEAVLVLASLKQLYRRVLQACAVERARLSNILRSHTEHEEGRHAYSLAETVLEAH